MASVTLGNYTNFVRNAAKGVPDTFIREKAARIELAHRVGETPEMLAREIELLYSLRRPGRTKTPRELAKNVMRVHDNTIEILKRA
jgi:hypothetical protein